MTKRARPRGKSSKKETARPLPAAPSPQSTRVITIRARDGKKALEASVTRAAGSILERLAEEWAYILRARPRWKDDADLRRSFGNRAVGDLERVGVTPAFVRRLSSVSRIEVELHKWNRSDSEAIRIYEAASEIPWEYLLSAATRYVGRLKHLLITRLFRTEARVESPPRPQNILFVQSAPGRLDDEYGFDSERVRIRAAVGAVADRVIDERRDEETINGERPGGPEPQRIMEILETPQVSKLESTVRTKAWQVIHVTGVDTHQVTQFIPDLYDVLQEKSPAIWIKIADSSGRIRDGMILRQRNVAELPVNYDELAHLLVNPKQPPSVVTLNLYHSGARTARELVNHGTHVALGFLDEIDDESAELFFQTFYSAWCRPTNPRSIPDAFLAAWQRMDFDNVHGTAIVIWVGQSVFGEFWRPPRTRGEPTELEEKREARSLEDMPIGELLEVDLYIDPEVNYSLLHNDRKLIEKLTLTKLVREPLKDIVVQVELNLGDQNYPFRCTHLVFDEPQLALAADVKIPLTATLPRSLRERVQSTVYVKVTCGGRTAFETTRRVTLIPVDEWLDDTDNNPWLPSFVLPRDPAILKIINSSRRYLIGIADDPAAGFDGYQSVDEEADDPSAGVDAQVRAIWTALVNEYRLQYINPPPAYSGRTQRLRTPSDILASNMGTCIDLALLLASCLEYIDIYPVVVLLTGHAFVGYWRSEEAYDEFVSVKAIPPAVALVGSPEARETALPYVDRYGWRLTKLNYNEIMEFVMSGDLVMLEATYLTAAYSFANAVEEGRANLRSRDEFDSLLDIRLARTADPAVSPLPIINE
jgi:hypothetical protein